VRRGEDERGGGGKEEGARGDGWEEARGVEVNGGRSGEEGGGVGGTPDWPDRREPAPARGVDGLETAAGVRTREEGEGDG
jgi:hypothetical protein